MLLHFRMPESPRDAVPPSEDGPRLQRPEQLTSETHLQLTRWRCDQKKQELEERVRRLMERWPEAGKATAQGHLNAFASAYAYWRETPHESIAAGHHEAFARNLEEVVQRFQYIFTALEREHSNLQVKPDVLREAGPGLLTRVQGKPFTWSLTAPQGVSVALRFDRYNSDLVFAPDTTGMGSMTDNRFRVERDPADPTRITIQSELEFSVTLSNGQSDSARAAQQREQDAVRMSL